MHGKPATGSERPQAPSQETSWAAPITLRPLDEVERQQREARSTGAPRSQMEAVRAGDSPGLGTGRAAGGRAAPKTTPAGPAYGG